MGNEKLIAVKAFRGNIEIKTNFSHYSFKAGTNDVMSFCHRYNIDTKEYLEYDDNTDVLPIVNNKYKCEILNNHNQWITHYIDYRTTTNIDDFINY